MNYKDYLLQFPPVRRLRTMRAIDALINESPSFFLGTKEDNYAATRECIIRCYKYLYDQGSFNKEDEIDYKSDCYVTLSIIIEPEYPFLAKPTWQPINNQIKSEFPRLLKEIHHHLRGEL